MVRYLKVWGLVPADRFLKNNNKKKNKKKKERKQQQQQQKHTINHITPRNFIAELY